MQSEIAKLKEQHTNEMKQKDEKLSLLKKQIADGLKDNSWYLCYINQEEKKNFFCN